MVVGGAGLGAGGAGQFMALLRGTNPPVTCAPPLVVTPVTDVLLQFPMVNESTADAL